MRDPLIIIVLFIATFSVATLAGNRMRESSLKDGFGIGLGITMVAIAIYMAVIGAFVFFLVVAAGSFLAGLFGISFSGGSSSAPSREYQTEEPRRHEPEATIPAFQETVRTEPAPVSQPTSSYNHSTVIDANTIYSYWAFVKTGTGSFIKVTVQAPNSYVAEQMLKNTYGSNLMTGAAMITQ
jgi:hypothetical protein